MLHGDLDRWEIQKEQDVFIFMIDSPCCTAETSTRLWKNYIPIKSKQKATEKLLRD